MLGRMPTNSTNSSRTISVHVPANREFVLETLSADQGGGVLTWAPSYSAMCRRVFELAGREMPANLTETPQQGITEQPSNTGGRARANRGGAEPGRRKHKVSAAGRKR